MVGIKMENDTYFGFTKVLKSDKQKLVNDVFDRVTNKYDVMNDTMSAGMHRIWKHKLVKQANIVQYDKILDLASGTGDIIKIIKNKHDNVELWASDINKKMLLYGADKLLNQGIWYNKCICDAQELPFANNYFDKIFIAFGLRNTTDINTTIAEMYRVLDTKGKLFILEFSKVNNSILDKLYTAYSFKFIPKVGKWVADDEESYRYLVESINKFPNQKELTQYLYNANFNKVNYTNLTFGVAAIHIATK